MIRAKLWFRCAAAHNPVAPVIIRPAVIGWERKQGQIVFQIERVFKGEELLNRMKGWVTVDPSRVIELVKEFGILKVLDDRELVVEMEEPQTFDNLQKALKDTFVNEVDIELIQKRR